MARRPRRMGLWLAGIEGFALSMGLILAIGPQNIFVLRQGLLRSHVFAVCLVCSLSDALLISAGVLGLGSVLAGIEGAELLVSVAAALFIGGYGVNGELLASAEWCRKASQLDAKKSSSAPLHF